jgi:LacI family transcriptional regulator
VTSAVQRVVERAGYDVLVYNTRDDPIREQSFVEWMLARGADAAILQSYRLSTADLDRMSRRRIPMVVLGPSPTHGSADNVVFDEVGATRELVSHLVRKGHRRIATITGPLRTWGGSRRLQGYREGMAEAGLATPEVYIREAEFFDAARAIDAARALAQLRDPPTAIVTGSDYLALAVQNALLDTGRRVPEDVAITGFDDTLLASMARPRLTTVRKSPELQAEAAFRLLEGRLRGRPGAGAVTETVRHELVARESA